jgi:hypothetical protein
MKDVLGQHVTTATWGSMPVARFITTMETQAPHPCSGTCGRMVGGDGSLVIYVVAAEPPSPRRYCAECGAPYLAWQGLA